jgi:hypothetical protein
VAEKPADPSTDLNIMISSLMSRDLPNAYQLCVTENGVCSLPELEGKQLILVTKRNGANYAAEREPSPPRQQPTSYVVPFTSIDAARVGRFSDDEPR